MKKIFSLSLAIFMVVSLFPRNCSASLPLDSEIEITNVDSEIPLVIVVSQRPSSYFINELNWPFCIEKIKSSSPNNQEYILDNGVGRVRLRFTDTSPRSGPDPSFPIEQADHVIIDSESFDFDHQKSLDACLQNIGKGTLVLCMVRPGCPVPSDFEYIIEEKSGNMLLPNVFRSGSTSLYALFKRAFCMSFRLEAARNAHERWLATMTESEELQSSNIALVNDINSNSPTLLPDDEIISEHDNSLTPLPDDEMISEHGDSPTPLPDDNFDEEESTESDDSSSGIESSTQTPTTPLPDDDSAEEESTESYDFSSLIETSTQTPTTPIPGDHTITIIPGLIIRDSEDRDIRTIPCSVM